MDYLFKFEYTFELSYYALTFDNKIWQQSNFKQRHYTTIFPNYNISKNIYSFILDTISLLQSKTHYVHDNTLLNLISVMVHKYHHSYLYWHFQF